MIVTERPTRNLSLDLLRSTEAAALAAARWVGLGNKNDGDQAAVDAMRLLLSTIPMRARVVIGEGEKDKAPCSITARNSAPAKAPRPSWP